MAQIQFFQKEDIKEVVKTLKSGWVSTAGNNIGIFEKKISSFTKSKYVVACNSGSSGLHVALIVAGVKNCDEVILPAISFIATANVVKYVGAKPIFIDVDNHFNLDIEKLYIFLKEETFMRSGSCYNKKTKKKIAAIIFVHVWGGAANIKKILKYCKEKNIKVIEDSTESLGTLYKKNYLNGKHTGTIGDIGILSFNGNKIITTGAGGAILTKSKKYYKKSKLLINQAKKNDFFVHDEIGYNYRMTSLNASLGISQLKNLKKCLKRKKNIYFTYHEVFKNSKIFNVYKFPNFSNNNFWMNLLLLKKNISKNFIDFLIKKYQKKIEFRRVWYPLYLQKNFKNSQKLETKNAEYLYKYSVCVPSSQNLDSKKIHFIFNEIEKCFIEYNKNKT